MCAAVILQRRPARPDHVRRSLTSSKCHCSDPRASLSPGSLPPSLLRADPILSSLKLVLWQGTQVVAGQVQVAILRSWARQVKAKNARLKLLQEEEEPAESEDGTIHPDPRGEDRAAGKAGEAAEAAMSKEELALEHQQPAAAKYLDEKV